MRTTHLRKTAAWPLVWIYAILIVYASLYPFDNWRVQGIAPWAFMTSPLPRYWTGFDVLSNVLGYAPFGFLLALALHRTHRNWPAIALTTLAAATLSLTMESLQMFLPVRVPSNVDAGLNILGALAGGAIARALEWVGLLDRWSRFRDRWFVSDASGALALLAVWPFALLFPAPVTFGLGQVLERVEAALESEPEGVVLRQAFDLQKVADIDYVVGNWYVCTHPESPFLGQMIAARTGPGLRKTLNNGSFAIHRLGQASERVQLHSVDEVLRVLREEFGIQVPEHPELWEIIERLIAGREGKGG